MAQQQGVSLTRVRRELVFERFLARLVAVAPHRWVLKGGLALDFRLGAAARTTRDMDLGRTDDETGAMRDFLAAQRADANDHFEFEVERTERLDNLAEGQATRFRVVASLAGRQFETVIIDVGFGDPVVPFDTVQTPGLLQFAGIEPVKVPTISIAQHVAEKTHAYTRAYVGGSSSRVKDLVDVVLFALHRRVDAAQLRQALDATFTARDTHPLPAAIPAPPRGWDGPYRRLAEEVSITASLVDAHAIAAALLDPILAGDVSEGSWEPAARRWAGAT